MIPPDIAEALKGINLFEAAVVVIAIIAAVWAVAKAVTWLADKFFPGLVAFAKAVVNGAQILAAVKDSPEFQERMTEAVESMQKQVGEIHHEVNFNNGTSVKDAVIRVERTSERLEEGVMGLHGRMDTVEGDLTHVKSEIGDLRAADEELREDLESTHNPLMEEPDEHQ